VRGKLIEKCRGTLARLKISKNGGSEFYNRAEVNLREYVNQIVKTWANFFKGTVTEATDYNLGTIYNALLSYSKELYKNYVANVKADGPDANDISASTSAGQKVTALEWLKNFLEKPGAGEWLDENGLHQSYMTLYADDVRGVKSLVNAIYAKLAAQQDLRKPKPAAAGAAPGLSELTCPHCSSVLRPAAPVPAGKKVRCPKCKETFTAGGAISSD
jgi:predicted Zn finger-like uncharacterized protein